MPLAEPASGQPVPKPPRCAMCRARMTVAGTDLAADGTGKVTYKCPSCAFTKTKIAGDPLNGGRYRPPRKKPAPRPDALVAAPQAAGPLRGSSGDHGG